MLTHRRAIRERKRRYKGLEREEPSNGRKETGESGIEEGETGKKKTKKKRNKNKKRKWRRKEQPISNTSAHKTNIIEDKEDDEEEVSYKKKHVLEEG